MEIETECVVFSHYLQWLTAVCRWLQWNEVLQVDGKFFLGPLNCSMDCRVMHWLHTLCINCMEQELSSYVTRAYSWGNPCNVRSIQHQLCLLTMADDVCSWSSHSSWKMTYCFFPALACLLSTVTRSGRLAWIQTKRRKIGRDTSSQTQSQIAVCAAWTLSLLE